MIILFLLFEDKARVFEITMKFTVMELKIVRALIVNFSV